MTNIALIEKDELFQLIKLAVRSEVAELKTGAKDTRKPATKKEVAEHLEISVATLDRLTKSGQIKSFNIGRAVKYNWEAVEAYINSKR